MDSLGLFATGEPGDFKIELDGIIACKTAEMWEALKTQDLEVQQGTPDQPSAPPPKGSGALH